MARVGTVVYRGGTGLQKFSNTLLANACETHEEKLVVWTLLDTGLRVAELANLTKDNLDWQNHRLMIYGKGQALRETLQRRVIPLSPRVQAILEGHLGLHDSLKIGVRTIQRMVKQVANRAHIRRPVTPHVLRHTFSVTCIQKGISTEPCKISWGMIGWPRRRFT